MRVVGFAASCAVVALALAPGRAAADPAAAERSFHAARDAYARGDYRAAAEAFEAAFREEPRGATIYNAALARQLAGQPLRAADDFDLALVQNSQSPSLTQVQVTDAKSRLRALEASMGRIDVSAGDGAVVSVPEMTPVPAPARIHVAPGSSVVHVAWPDGQAVDRTAMAAAAEVVVLTVHTPEKVPIVLAPLPPVAEPSPAGAHRTWAFVAGGVGAGGILLGAVTGVMTISAKQTVSQHCGINGVPNDCTAEGASAGNRGETTGLISTIGFTVGLAGAGAAVVLWLTEPHPRKAETKVGAWQPFVTTDGAHTAVVGARGRW